MSLLGGPAEQNLAVLPGIPGLLGGDLHEGEVAMIDDAFVFDCVAHVFNFDPKNAFGNAGLMFDNHLYAFHNALTPDDHPKLPPEEFLRQWTPSDSKYSEVGCRVTGVLASTGAYAWRHAGVGCVICGC